ncbi:unnamed protein product [Sphagnum jensenii]
MRAERTPNDTVTFMLQQPHPTDTPSIPMLRQIVQINNDDSDRGTTERLGSSNHKEVGARWSEICRRIKVDRNLDEGRQQQIWEVLERYQDVFTWNKASEDDDFCEEIQDVGNAQIDTHVEEGRLLFVRTGRVPQEVEGRGENGIVQSNAAKLVLPRKRPCYYDKQQQLELVLAAQRLLEEGEQNSQSADLEEEEECRTDSKGSDIWEDVSCMELLQGGLLPANVDPLESKRARKRILNYHWQGQSLYFRGLLVPKPEDRMGLVVQMHKDLGHFGEERTLAEVCRRTTARNQDRQQIHPSSD